MYAGKELIDAIVLIEWDMFQAVNEDGPKADCQEDRDTFEAMRRAQFQAWSPAAAESYLEDLNAAVAAGRNLVMEKYIHMMKSTMPSQYEKALHLVTMPSDAAMALVCEISDKMLAQTEQLHKDYPYVSGSGRPLYTVNDWQGVTSIETYQKSELMTYSEKTLKALAAHVAELDTQGIAIARLILENSSKYYGYKTLDEAEAATKKRIDEIGIQISYGCSSCDE